MRDGHYSINIGDYMQTLSIRKKWCALGVADCDIVEIDRDQIKSYSGEKVLLPVNACFYDHCFPFPKDIIPIFIGFQADSHLISRNVDYLKRYEPIGCRDLVTAKILNVNGISAFVTGCVTLTIPQREKEPGLEEKTTFFVYGEGAGSFPSEVLSYVPPRSG